VDSFARTALCGLGKTSGKYKAGHHDGVTSADLADRFLLATNQSTQTLSVVELSTQRILAVTPLDGAPDYVRWIADSREVWVTEPDQEQIEVFSVTDNTEPALRRVSVIRVPGGPESLAVDEQRAAAYTHLWSGFTLRVDLKTHSVTHTWPNGCQASRGIALDPRRGFLFVGCSEGKASVLDLNANGRVLGAGSAGAGVDIISVNLSLNHLYLPSAREGNVTVLGIGSKGELRALGSLGTGLEGTHCVASDDRNKLWLCSPERGEVVVLEDTLPRQ
jgi:DNA-binding beta-propeller fold protein YncE